MYFCISKYNDFYTVLDSNDNVRETVSKNDLINYLKSGIEIYGVSLESLSLDDITKILIDLPSREVRAGQVFNGYFFEDYDESNYNMFHNVYLYSTIRCDSVEEVIELLPILQEANKSIFYTISGNISKSILGYKITDVVGNGIFNVLDLSNAVEYGFTYCDVCFSLMHEKLLVEGFTDLTEGYVSINGCKFSIIDSIKYNYTYVEDSTTYYCEKLEEDSDYLSIVNVTSRGVDTFIKNYGNLKLSSTLFPMVSLNDYLKDSSVYFSYLSRLLDSVSDCSNYSGRKGDKFVFGDLDLDWNIALLLHNVIDSEQFYNDFEAYKPVKEAKDKLLYGAEAQKLNKRLKTFRINDDYIKDSKKFEDVYDYITDVPYYDSVKTDFGSILTATYSRDNRFRKIGGIGIFRLTHRATYYYRIGRSGITIELNGSNSNYVARHIIASEEFTVLLDNYRDELGYYYNRPNIVPLFIHNIVEHEDGVEINIVVAINSNCCKSFKTVEKGCDNRQGWGSLFLVVPLLLTGVRHYIRGDFVIFDMLFQEVALSKSLYNNLIADVDEFNNLISIDSCANTSSAKYCNCSIGNPLTTNSNSMIECVVKEMKAFNWTIDRGNYFE